MVDEVHQEEHKSNGGRVHIFSVMLLFLYMDGWIDEGVNIFTGE